MIQRCNSRVPGIYGSKDFRCTYRFFRLLQLQPVVGCFSLNPCLFVYVSFCYSLWPGILIRHTTRDVIRNWRIIRIAALIVYCAFIRMSQKNNTSFHVYQHRLIFAHGTFNTPGLSNTCFEVSGCNSLNTSLRDLDAKLGICTTHWN